MVWISKVAVPANGVESAPVSDEELLRNLDPKTGPKPTLESLRAATGGPCAYSLLTSVR